MLKKIAVQQLQIGMYVHLPLSWYEHTFLKNNFAVTTEHQLVKIRNSGLQEVTIDTEKGIDLADATASPPLTSTAPVEKQILLDELMAAIQDKHLPAPEKAALIHERAIDMMYRLLETPSADNIKTVKKGITEVVNLILSDDATTHQLLLITSHDFYTYTHSVSVGVLGIALSKILFKKSAGHNMNELGAGFFLHDLGKIQIDQAILNKPGRLTDEEMNEVRRHPNLGFKILNDTKQLTEECKLIVLQHHERQDGNGYPKRLKGDKIHIYGRICMIADVYDALTSDRPYRKKMTPFAALDLMRNEMLEHFQRDLFEKFVQIFR